LSGAEADAGWPRARTRLFLSADIAGSTAYKQRKTDDPGTAGKWAHAILSFYRDFGQCFFEKLALAESAVSNCLSYKPCQRPLFWKAVGDEVLFCLELDCEKQSYVAVVSWINAAREYKKTLKKERLDLKVAAWLATFPTPNYEVVLPRSLDGTTAIGQRNDDALVANWHALKQYYSNGSESQKDFALDFIGPAMDTGFRIAQQSTTRRMAITPELARLVALSHDSFQNLAQKLDDNYKLDLRYQGRTHLKGVGDPSGYPIFWLDTAERGDKFVQFEDALDGHIQSNSTVDKNNFLAAYLGDFAPFKTHLYLPSADNKDFSVLHPDLATEISEIQSRFQLEDERLSSEMSSQNDVASEESSTKISPSEIEQLVK
jgi:hypothetical protein